MRKSKYVFLIFAVLYVLISVLNVLNIVIVGENIMFGLTFSAFFMSLSDVCNNAVMYRITRNELGYISYVTSNILQEYISGGIKETPLVDVINLKKNVEQLVPNYKEKIHPNKFYMNKINKMLSILGNACFILAIVSFVVTPYFAINLNQKISVGLTLLAFSIMCFNIFISEIAAEYLDKKNNFMNNTQIIIQSFVPDFSVFLNKSLFHEDSFMEIRK